LDSQKASAEQSQFSHGWQWARAGKTARAADRTDRAKQSQSSSHRNGRGPARSSRAAPLGQSVRNKANLPRTDRKGRWMAEAEALPPLGTSVRNKPNSRRQAGAMDLERTIASRSAASARLSSSLDPKALDGPKSGRNPNQLSADFQRKGKREAADRVGTPPSSLSPFHFFPSSLLESAKICAIRGFSNSFTSGDLQHVPPGSLSRKQDVAPLQRSAAIRHRLPGAARSACGRDFSRVGRFLC
jgi:hypothetical protein